MLSQSVTIFDFLFGRTFLFWGPNAVSASASEVWHDSDGTWPPKITCHRNIMQGQVRRNWRCFDSESIHLGMERDRESNEGSFKNIGAGLFYHGLLPAILLCLIVARFLLWKAQAAMWPILLWQHNERNRKSNFLVSSLLEMFPFAGNVSNRVNLANHNLRTPH